MAKIVLDLVADGHEDVAKAIAAKHCVERKLLREVGPGGGNPEYEFRGEREALARMVAEDWEDASLAESIED